MEFEVTLGSLPLKTVRPRMKEIINMVRRTPPVIKPFFFLLNLDLDSNSMIFPTQPEIRVEKPENACGEQINSYWAVRQVSSHLMGYIKNLRGILEGLYGTH